MKAILSDKGLELKDIQKPERKKGESLIKVLYAGICGTDIEIEKGYMNFKGVIGHEFVGIVEEGRLKGKRVCGEINIGCGCCDYCKKELSRHCPDRRVLGIYKKDGTFAEYVTLPDINLYPVPDVISDLEAVFIEPVAASLEIFEQVKISPDTKTAVVGDGKLGQIIAQVVKLTGCYLKVFGKNEKKLEFLKKLNIDTEFVSENINDKYDFVIECSGSPDGFVTALNFIKPRGTIILKSTIVKPLKFMTSKVVVDEITIIGSRCGRFSPAIRLLKNKLIKVDYLISNVFPIEQYKKAFVYAKRKDVFKVLLKI
jgi:threonine dehydrogenase-like Zn-dependent dehydrogenase